MKGSKDFGVIQGGGTKRWALVLIAVAMTCAMGVRIRPGHADGFSKAVMAGRGRAQIKITRVGPTTVGADGEVVTGDVEALARLTFSSELSSFTHGLYVRTTFALPPDGERAVLIVDVDRERGAKTWTPGHNDIQARFYTVGDDGATLFGGATRSGSINLEASVATAQGAGFRMRGWIENTEVGADRVPDTEDDRGFELEFTLESEPAPETIAGMPGPTTPVAPPCEPPFCWEDPTYTDPLIVTPGCGDADVSYETSDDGCGTSDSYTDDVVQVGTDPDPGTSDPGTLTSTDTSSSGCDTTSNNDDQASACGGTDDGSSTGSDGCGGGDTGSDSGSSCDSGSSSSDTSSCGGCTGDTAARPATGAGSGARVQSGDAGFGWFSAGLFFSALGAAIRRRR